MSARALPVAARLSQKHLALLLRARDGWIQIHPHERRRAERLEPAFLEVHAGRAARITPAGLSALTAHGK